MRKRITSPVAPDVLALIVGLLILVSSGCLPKTHINNVAPEMQESELFIYRTGHTPKTIDESRDAAFETTIKLFKSGKMDAKDFSTAVKASEAYDLAYEAAVKALDTFAKASRRGEDVTTASVDAAMAAVQSALKKLQGGE